MASARRLTAANMDEQVASVIQGINGLDFRYVRMTVEERRQYLSGHVKHICCGSGVIGTDDEEDALYALGKSREQEAENGRY